MDVRKVLSRVHRGTRQQLAALERALRLFFVFSVLFMRFREASVGFRCQIFAAADWTVCRLYAGSLVNLMEHGIRPALEKAIGDELRGYGSGLNFLVNQIKCTYNSVELDEPNQALRRDRRHLG